MLARLLQLLLALKYQTGRRLFILEQKSLCATPDCVRSVRPKSRWSPSPMDTQNPKEPVRAPSPMTLFRRGNPEGFHDLCAVGTPVPSGRLNEAYIAYGLKRQAP
ncbi:hypothetical protein EVAR_100629_1 [Eumeta japonica]|uniref:Uncharacterized protein n=1 Tax=Eumeta variegata TaxID=151549 RepID=A0A4C2A1T9_EUMVA|nr:hypothetical protein EVAR_100629_1 [Eumeta japonica]